ncbi:MAG: DUF4091 domain-containing protein [Armatimonadetes bacterium]|nr:DUF4091 domain-containing protein [Armatimonadota bacterium]
MLPTAIRCTALGSCLILAGLPDEANAVPAHAEFEPADPSPLADCPNLLLGATIDASPHWSDRGPQFVLDGRHDNPGDHWAAETLPVHLPLALAQPATVNAVRLWTFWDNHRYYQYFIEGSADGEAWTRLADNTANTTPQSAAGELFVFPETTLKALRVTFTRNSASNVAGGHIVEIEALHGDPEALQTVAARARKWEQVAPGLHGAVASLDLRYPRDSVPEVAEEAAWSGTAWRGDRASAQLLLWSREPMHQLRLAAGPLQGDGATIPAGAVRARFVRYVLADGHLQPDILDTATRLDLPARSVRPVWVSLDVPAEQKPGVYRGQLTATAAGLPPVTFDLALEVLPQTLPAPGQWRFWLDLWQNPFAVARYHHVEPWSPEHLALLEPQLRLLAEAGQKCITTTLIDRPWGTQTYDPYDAMIDWVKRSDGTWRYDYTHFDRYVELAMRCGIRGSINCFSLVPWTNRYAYLDEAGGEVRALVAGPDRPEYAAHWEPFLRDFSAHLKAKGWLGRTAIAMDERPPELMQPAMALLKAAAPDLRVALAGNWHESLNDGLDDYCVFIQGEVPPEVIEARERAGRQLTFYVCCGPGRPNTFVFSPPAEAAWLGWYAAAKHYTGFLRWAYDSFVEDPLHDTSYVTWPAGDCFLVYPGARSSIRFERLREGIAACEKVGILRAKLAGRPELAKLEEALAGFRFDRAQTVPAAETVAAAGTALVEASRATR